MKKRGERKQGKLRGQRDREGRQEGFQGVLGNCETTGFEVRNREECNEVTEIGDILHDELLINDESGDGSKLLEETTVLDDSGLPNSLQY